MEVLMLPKSSNSGSYQNVSGITDLPIIRVMWRNRICQRSLTTGTGLWHWWWSQNRLLPVALFPDAPTVTSSGVAGLRPLYSKIECPGTPPPR